MWRHYQLLILTSCLALFASVALASGKEATVNVEVRGGTWKSIRLKNLPKGAVVALDMSTDGAVTVTLVDEADHRRAPDFREPLFTSRVDRKISFSVTIPSPGNFYVVFDNRLTAASRSINLTVHAERGKTRDRNAAAERILKRFENQLNKVFIFEPFPVHVKECGQATTFVRDSGIVLCAQYARKLHDMLADQARSSDALLFSLFHEVGHIFPQQWKHPSYGNEKMADEFATAIMVMLNLKQHVLEHADFFSANPSLSENLAKTLKDDHHPLSIQRARNISRWAKDLHLLEKWQRIFVPHMQTHVLERLQNRPPPWADLALINEELASRR